MKLKVRTLNNTEAEVDVDKEATLVELKKCVEEVFPHMEASKQMLIHQGKILSDNMKISDYPNIKENDKLVVLLPKPRQQRDTTSGTSLSSAEAAVSCETTTATASRTASDQASSGPVDPPEANTPVKPEAEDAAAAGELRGDSQAAGSSVSAVHSSLGALSEPASSSAPSTSVVSGESALVTGDSLHTVIASICAMGFPEAQVRAAMQAAFNNPDRAVEYLMTGIPETQDSQPPSSSAPSVTGLLPNASPLDSPGSGEQGALAEGGLPSGTETSGEGNLAVLRQHPLFERIRAAIQVNPQLLPGMLQMINLQNPELAELIVNNQVEFIQMLSEGADRPVGGGPEGQVDPAHGTPGGGPVTISITPEQQEAVRRLEGLGFSESAVVQALVVSDWNENRAANFLFDNMGDSEDENEDDGSSH